jgi:hypothetical protein
MHFMWSLCLTYSLILPIAYRERLYHRIMLATFICFLPLSLAIFIGTWVSIASNNRWFIYSLCFRCKHTNTSLYISQNIIGHAIRRCAMGSWRVRHFGDMHNSGVYIYNILPCVSILLCIT